MTAKTASDPSIVQSLIESLASSDGLVRQKARRALVEMGTSAVGPLIAALADGDGHTRWEAAKALTSIKAPESAPALARALEDETFGVRWLAADGLIVLGQAGLVPLLQALVKHADSIGVREGAHHVLRILVDRGFDQVKPVLAALDDVQPVIEVPLAAARVLESLPGDRHE